MTWNYRVVKHVMDASGEEVTEYGIHEVYYDDDGKCMVSHDLWVVEEHLLSDSELAFLCYAQKENEKTLTTLPVWWERELADEVEY